MRFVPVKTEDQQSTLAIHRVRETRVAQKTQLINALRAHLAEFGIVAPQGAGKVSQLTAVVADADDTRVPALAGGRRVAVTNGSRKLCRRSRFQEHRERSSGVPGGDTALMSIRRPEPTGSQPPS
jgi:transposase